jgi:Uncharacterised nucleotidyltransferase
MLRWNETGDFLTKSAADQADTLSTEWRVLLECANPHFATGRLGQLLSESLDWPRLLILAEDQGILPLLTSRLGEPGENVVPMEVRQKLRDSSRSQMLFTLSLTAELFRILDHFAALGISVLLTKGPVLSARCYDDPGLRQYTDLDLILGCDDMEHAAEAMIALGYEGKVSQTAIQAGKAPGEYVFAKKDRKVLVEFHTERTFRYHPKTLPIEKLFARQTRVRLDGREVPALSAEDELILICIHGAKHFWERLMWIADVAALVSKQSPSWERTIMAACEVRAERMLRVGLLLAKTVAGARLPTEVSDYVNTDAQAGPIAAKIARRLPVVDAQPFGLLGRAAFRMRMGGGLLTGARYLLRLSFSPTEEDWGAGAEEKRPWPLDAIRRPFRLARKYGRDAKS